MRVILCGRRSIWWGWMVTPVAPRIVNDVSYVTTIKHASHSVWQARYLVRLDRDTCCSAHCKWRGHEDERKCKSNIVCLCGLQWLCLLSVGDLQVNVSSGRMSLRIAATKTKRKSKSNSVCFCGLQWLCLLSVGDLRVNVSSGRMSLRTAATKTRENVKAILYVFADCFN